MRDFLPSLQSGKQLNFASLVTDMLTSESVEQLLTIFLTNMGERLNVDRVAVCRAIAPQQIQVLVEAIASDCKSIKNNIYPTKYFGFDCFPNFPRDRAITFTDTAQVTETLSIHQQWQSTRVSAMICAPILFDFPDPDSQSHIWGLTIVQSHQPRYWQPQEANCFFEITQVLGECLQYWSLLMRSAEPLSSNKPLTASPPNHLATNATNLSRSNNISNLQSSNSSNHKLVAPLGECANLVNDYTHPTEAIAADDFDELQCTRVIAPLIQDAVTTEISIIDSFGLTEDKDLANEDDQIVAEPDTVLNQAINQAMQRLENYFDLHSDMDNETVDAESKTEEDILENIAQLSSGSSENRAEYLQQKVIILIADLQQKAHEIEVLQSQVQKLVKVQDKFREVLVSLQSENLSQRAKDAVTAIYNAISS